MRGLGTIHEFYFGCLAFGIEYLAVKLVYAMKLVFSFRIIV